MMVALVLAGIALFTASTHHVVEAGEAAAITTVATPAQMSTDEAAVDTPTTGDAAFVAETTGLVAAFLGCVLLALCSLMLLPRLLRLVRAMIGFVRQRAPMILREPRSSAPRLSSPSLLLLSVSRI